MEKREVVKNNIYIAIGPILMIACIFLLPNEIFATLEMRAAIGTVAWMAFWWVSSCIDYAITGFLPIAVNAIIVIAPMNTVLANYSSETIMLLLGASILTVSWEIVGLDKRIAYTFLALIGTSLRSQIIFWFFLTVAMSSLLPNSIVCATVAPIAVSMLKYVNITDIKESEIGAILLLTIGWGAGLGGLATPLGGAMNLVVVDYIEQVTGTEFLYVDWIVKFLPIMIVLVISNLLFLMWIMPKGQSLHGTKQYFVEEKKKLGKISGIELACFLLFIIAAGLSFARPLYLELIPALKPAYIFIIAGIVSFLIRKPDGNRLMVWKIVQKKIIWDLIFIFAGGLALGTLINESGAATALGEVLSSSQIDNSFLIVLMIVTLTIILSDITSNTATAAVAMPIVLGLALAMNLDPVPYMLAATIGVNLSYCMPTSIRAIPVGYGLSPSYMLKHGIKLTLIVIVLMTVLAWALITYWPWFSVI